MSAVVALREDYSGEDLRALAAKARDGAQARRLMALAAVADGKDRREAAAIGLMDRQRLRDWVHRFNADGPDGLINTRPSGRPPALTASQKKELRRIVEDGPLAHGHDVVRWRRIDLASVTAQRFGVSYHETTIGRILRKLGLSRISARPSHPKRDEQAAETFKKTSPSGSPS
jgi:transposase